jgi:hypothetical protein
MADKFNIPTVADRVQRQKEEEAARRARLMSTMGLQPETETRVSETSTSQLPTDKIQPPTSPSISMEALKGAYQGVSLGEAQRRYKDDLLTLKETPIPGADPSRLQRAQEAARDRVSSVLSGGTEKTLAAKVTQTPSTVPVGGKGTQPSEEKPTTAAAGKQEKKPFVSPTASMGSIAAAINKEQNKDPQKPIGKQSKEELLASLDSVEEQVKKDMPDSPIRTDLLALRAEAYKAYKEKANRNEWMDLAERAINSIGQFAAARSATGGFVAGFPQSRTDYGARTEQAFREYQAELGLASEQERADERRAERKEAAREREITRRRGTISEALQLRKEEERTAAELERERIRAGASEKESKQRFQRDVMKLGLDETKEELAAEKAKSSQLDKAIQLGNLLGTGKVKDYDKEIANFASAINTLPQTIEAQGAEISGSFWELSKPSTKDGQLQAVRKLVAGLIEEKKRLDTTSIPALQRHAERLRSGFVGQPVSPAAAPAAAPSAAKQQPPASTGQTAPADGKIRFQLPDGTIGSVPEAQVSGFLKKNPQAKRLD